MARLKDPNLEFVFCLGQRPESQGEITVVPAYKHTYICRIDKKINKGNYLCIVG